MKVYLILILAVFSILSLKAQTLETNMKHNLCSESYESTDSINSVNLINDFYSNQTSLSRTYDYELLNKKRKYEKWGKDIQIFGYGFTLGVLSVGGWLANKNHWSLGWYLPTGAVIICGGIYGFLKWSKYYENKAASIQISPIYSYSINDKFSVQAMAISDYYHPKDIGFGIGFTTKF